MQCICGAHWCYWCQKSTRECDGNCGERDEEDDEEHEDYDSEEDEVRDEVRQANMVENRVEPRLFVASDQNPPQSSQSGDVGLVNLDAGGDRRWGDGYVESVKSTVEHNLGAPNAHVRDVLTSLT